MNPLKRKTITRDARAGMIGESGMVEPPQPEDTPAINRMAEDSGLFSPAELASLRDMLATFFNPGSDDDHLFLVYRQPGHESAAGFVCYGPTPFTDRVWDLYWICVDRASQRRGVGRALVENMDQALRAHAARAIYLETSNAEAYRIAREFYERMGFERVAHIDDYYARGNAKMIYRKILG